MSKARDLADSVSTGGILEDGAVSVSEISDLTVTAAELNNVAGVNSDVQTQLDLKAPLASPTFTGNVGVGTSSPTAPLEVIGGQLRVADSIASSMFLVSPSSTYSDGIELHSTYNGGGSFGPMKFYTSSTERFRIGSSGELGIGGATYGTAGQVLTSGGSGAAPSWQSVSFTTNVITTNTTATANNHYYLNGSAITLTLPASPSVGDEVRISEVAGNTDCVIGRNGSNIMSSGTDLTIDTGYTVIYLRYVDATIGWAFS